MKYKIIDKATCKELDYSKYALTAYGDVLCLANGFVLMNKTDFHIILGDWNLVAKKLPFEKNWVNLWLEIDKPTCGYYFNGNWYYANGIQINCKIIAWVEMVSYYKP
jgi:hypothetical protein